MAFIPLQKILPKALQSIGLSREAQAALVCERYRKLAPQFVHEEALLHTIPRFFRDKILTVGITNPAWAGQINKGKKELIDAINKSFSKKTIADIKTRMVEKIE